jgi:hypothetical protein
MAQSLQDGTAWNLAIDTVNNVDYMAVIWFGMIEASKTRNGG